MSHYVTLRLRDNMGRSSWLTCFVFSLLTAVCIVHGQREPNDPCLTKDYKEINEPHRSTGFKTEPPERPLCDSRLRRGWFRFTNQAGGEMPTTCQETNKCGTTMPIWLDGRHPTVEEGIAMIPICVNMNNSEPNARECCQYTEDIFVRNCGGFYVYYLYPTQDCDSAYCAGHVPPCPVGKWSHDSFPPCKDPFPIMKAAPELTGPSSEQGTAQAFRCQVIYGENDPDQRFEIQWIFNGVADPKIALQTLSGSDKMAALDLALLKDHTDTNVACQVRSYYVGHEKDKSRYLTSNSTYFGLQHPPTLTGPIQADNKSFEFQCEMIFNDNSSQEIELVWTFDGEQDLSITPQIITSPNSHIVLDGSLLKGHLNKKIGCQARLIHQGTDVKTKFIMSNTYFVGIQVTPNPLEMSEIDFEKYVTVTSTLPVVCDLDQDCCLTVKLNVNETSAVSLINSCEYRICSSDWDPVLKSASTKIGVVPTRNVLVQNDKRVVLAFAVNTPRGLGSYLDIFHGYQPDPIQVSVKDERTFQCSLTGDPHIMGFDFQYMYDLYKSGDFIAYMAEYRDFMIQVRTIPCGGGSVACICGIVVRERDNVIKLNRCSNLFGGSTTIDIAYTLSAGTIVQRSQDGNRFGIYLPSGTEVKIDSGAINLYISIPAFDKGLGSGICGTPDGKEDNDFTRPDGTVDPPCTQRCIPDAFLESWRVTGNESLFEVVPNLVNTTDPVYGFTDQYCSCHENTLGDSTISCSPRENVQMANTACPGCPEITELLIPSYVVGVGWVKVGATKPDPPFVPPEIKPVDPNRQWPNDQGVTETQARDICLQAIRKSQLYFQCQKFGQLEDSVLSDCLADVLHGGTTAFMDDITSAYTTQCQLALAQNPDNYIPNADGDQVLKPELLDHICPVECFRHGLCGAKGQCICNHGWEGETCLIEIGKGPQLMEIQGGLYCDVTKNLCLKINIDITNINYMDPLWCRIQPLDEEGNSVGNPVQTVAEFLSPTMITCSLGGLGQSTQRYNISTTKDGIIFGNELPYRKFDGTCLECDAEVCKEKNTACHIDGVCYKNGAVNPLDRNQTCDISKSTTSWTRQRHENDRFPIIITPPVATGPNIQTNMSANFQCEVMYTAHDPDQVFEVAWLFDKKSHPLIQAQLLYGQERITTLDINLLKDQVNKYVGCQVRSYYSGHENEKSQYLASNTIYFGIQQPPVLTGPIMPDNASFIFECEVIYDDSSSSQEIEVVWIFDGHLDVDSPSQILSGSNRSVVLDGASLKGYLGTNIGCQARLIFPQSEVKTLFLQSNIYFIGIQITPDPLEMSEIDFEKFVTVTSTIPIICNDDSDCCLTIKLNVNQTSAVSLLNTCEHKICSSAWDSDTNKASIQVGVVPNRNVLRDGVKSVLLAFRVIPPAGAGVYLDVFEDYSPRQSQITVKDETSFTCSLTGDPHIMGFDFKYMYDLYKSGDYIAYEAQYRDFMIQVRTTPCGSVACICGIVVKERDNVIKVDSCESTYYGPASIDIAYDLSPGTVIQRSEDGHRFGIYLPSGSEVKIDSSGINVYISIPAFDKDKGRGLCGTTDGIEDNDFTHPDGTVDPACTQRCIPEAFLESWRVTGNGSLFEVVPEPLNTTDPVYGFSDQYCSCHEDTFGNSTVSCSARENVQTANTACPGCPVITDLLIPSYVVGVGWVKPGADKPDPPFVHPEVKPVDPNKQWPNDQGVTEAEARDLCTQAIHKSQLYPYCQKFGHLEASVMSDCLADVLFGGTTAFMDDITSAFTTRCQLILAQNPDNYMPNDEGDPVLKPELLDNICPVECFTHGQCGAKGQCFCHDGWEGETCLIDIGKGPQLMEIQGGFICDNIKRSCETLIIDVTNINLSAKLQIRFQPVDEQGNNIGAAVIIEAVFLTPTTISCTLPRSGKSTQRYIISATKDGAVFGNEISFRVFDSTCLDCSLAECTEKNTACHIDNVCYKNGEINKSDRNRTCDITKSTTRWTRIRDEQDHFPILVEAPIITGPIFQENGSTVFECEVIFDLNDPDQVFEVVWLFNGQRDPSVPVHLLYGQEKIATLNINQLKGQVDKIIFCQVRSYYIDSEHEKSSYLSSNQIYFGLQKSPLLTGPTMNTNNSFIFECEVFYDANNSSQKIEVVWTFDNQLDPAAPSIIISGSTRYVVLDGMFLRDHLGTNIGCQSRLIFPGSDVTTSFIKSNTYFAGIQFNPNPVQMSEIDFEKYITVTSTIPIVCDHNLECCLTFRLNLNETSAVSLVNTCKYELCSSDWDSQLHRASIQVGVVPNQDFVLQGNKRTSLTLEVIKSTGFGYYFDVFENYNPSQIEISVKDEAAFKCSFTGDPHITGFDHLGVYDLYESGDFIAYLVEERDFMVQIRAVPCGVGAVSCICGITVRERNNVVKVSKCQNTGLPSVDIAYNLSPGTVIQRSADGYRIGVYLPSGSEVKIERGGTNVYLSIPAFDKGSGRGLCGTNDGIADNDFTHRNGTVDRSCTQRCIPHAFFESWRVSGNESLFEVVPDPVNITDSVDGSSTQYCSCVENSNRTSAVSCSERQYLQRTNTACPNCPVITDFLTPSYIVGVGWVRPGTNKPDPPFVHPEVKPLDPNKPWPNDQGVTEAQARDKCTQAIHRSQLYPQCQEFGQLEASVMPNCLADILFGGTTDYLDDHTAAYTTLCQLTLAQNPDNYIPNDEGIPVLKPELLTDVCPVECQIHGQCGAKGQCICHDGWEGETCLIESGKGPQLLEIQGGRVCDVSQKSCDKINIEVTNINYLDQIQFRVLILNEQGNVIGTPIVVATVFMTPPTLSCRLPIVGLSSLVFKISATKNGQDFGNELIFRVFDGTCLDCDITQCTEKKTACHINKRCYKNGEVNKNNGNETCDITKSTTEWTRERDENDRYPKLDTPPVLIGPNISSAIFQCEVVYKAADPDQAFEVSWVFNGIADQSIPSQFLFAQERVATLDINVLKQHIDRNVGCQVRSFYVGYENDKSSYLASNTVFFGIGKRPVLSGPIMQNNNKSFIFECEVSLETTSSSQEVEVLWLADGEAMLVTQTLIISDTNVSVVLDGVALKGFLGTNIACQARLSFEPDFKTSYWMSNTYFVGIQINPNPFEMREGDFEKYITVTSTVPLACDYDLDCCVNFRLNMNESRALSFLNTCEHKLCSSDWNQELMTASIKVGIIPNKNVLVEGNKGLSMALDVIVPLGFPYLDIFSNYQPNKLQVVVTDEAAFRCSFTGDPHIMGFDFKHMIDLYKSGDFVAYVAKEKDFMIQVRTYPCGGGDVTCVCGTAIREGNNIIKISRCHNPNSGPTLVDIAYKLSPGTVIQRSEDGYRFGVYLPSGSEVKIESGGINVYISLPADHKGEGRGLCGTNDGFEDNDFTHPDGTVDPACSQRCIPNAFLDSWRVLGNESLFEIVPDPINTTDSVSGSSRQYCSCLERSNGTSAVSCSAAENILRTNTACPGCPVITDLLTPSYIVGVGWVRPGTNKPDPPFVHPEVKPVDPNKPWPNDQGVTEAQARDMCTQAIHRSQLYPQCQKFGQLETSVMSDCMADILYGGTMAYVDEATAAYTTQCQLTLAQNPDNYIPNTDGDPVLKPELLDHICPGECFRHGDCGAKGQCICQAGWEGETCLIESGKGPQLTVIQGDAVCDQTQKSCGSVHIDVTNINSMERLQCRLQEVDANGKAVGAPVLTTAVFTSPTTISCTIPTSVQALKTYNISATKDGVVFGSEVVFQSFDGTCLNCSINGCVEKNTACHIENVCYRHGESDQNDSDRICDVNKSSTSWTLKNENPATTTPEPIFPTRPAHPHTMRPCHFCYGG